MAIHVKTWTGAGNARVTEMVNAGKRGKSCRVFGFQGWMPHGGDETHERIRQLNRDILFYLNGLMGRESFDDVRAAVAGKISEAGLPEHAGRIYDEEIRGIDAPKRELRAGVEGKWSAGADETGVGVYDVEDQYNLPASITHDQTKAAAYAAAAKVWGRVEQAKTYSEACAILRDAGCRLHSYCRID